MFDYFFKDTSENTLKEDKFICCEGEESAKRHFACLQPTQACWGAKLNTRKVGEFASLNDSLLKLSEN